MPRSRKRRRSGEERRDILLVERLVAETLAALPEPLRAASEELVVVVAARTEEDDGEEELYGLFEGLQRGARDGYGDAPARITLYALPLVEDFGEAEELAAEIRRTIVHEIGHYLGFDDEELHRRGLE